MAAPARSEHYPRARPLAGGELPASGDTPPPPDDWDCFDSNLDWILENDFIAIEEEEDCRRDGGIGCQDADANVAGMGGLGLYEDTYGPGLEYCAGAYDMLEQAS